MQTREHPPDTDGHTIQTATCERQPHAKDGHMIQAAIKKVNAEKKEPLKSDKED